MNHREIAKGNMYKKMLVFFNNPVFVLTWASATRLVAEIANFASLDVSLSNCIQQQQLDIKGITIGKNKTFVAMVTIIVKDAHKAFVWAVDSANDKLTELFDVVKTDFLNIPENLAYAACKNIRDAISLNITSMVTVGLLPADVTEINDTIKKYESTIGTPGAALSSKMEGTQGIEDFMKPMDESLVLIDRLMISTFEDSEPEMVGEYKNNRNIDNLPTHHSGVVAHIIDNITGKNLEGATMTIGTKTVSSNISGIAEIIKTKWGIFNVTIAHGDYVSQTSTVTIVRGKISKMEVAMVIKIRA